MLQVAFLQAILLLNHLIYGIIAPLDAEYLGNSFPFIPDCEPTNKTDLISILLRTYFSTVLKTPSQFTLNESSSSLLPALQTTISHPDI